MTNSLTNDATSNVTSNTTKSRMRTPMTHILLFIMIAVFIIQVASGVDIISPTASDMVRWGANQRDLNTGGEPWRLISSAFVHIGLMHLLINCVVMYLLGRMAERLYGSWQILVIFLLSAIGGGVLTNGFEWYQLAEQAKQLESVTSSTSLSALSTTMSTHVSIHSPSIIYHTPITSAGASTAIMGLGGALLMMAWLSKDKFNQLQEMTPMFLTVMIVASFVYDYFNPVSDSAGHLGGLIMGMLYAGGYYLVRKNTAL